MEKNTRTKNILLIVLLVAVLTLSIAYAGLSQYLYINSQTVVEVVAQTGILSLLQQIVVVGVMPL